VDKEKKKIFFWGVEIRFGGRVPAKKQKKPLELNAFGTKKKVGRAHNLRNRRNDKTAGGHQASGVTGCKDKIDFATKKKGLQRTKDRHKSGLENKRCFVFQIAGHILG